MLDTGAGSCEVLHKFNPDRFIYFYAYWMQHKIQSQKRAAWNIKYINCKFRDIYPPVHCPARFRDIYPPVHCPARFQGISLTNNKTH